MYGSITLRHYTAPLFRLQKFQRNVKTTPPVYLKMSSNYPTIYYRLSHELENVHSTKFGCLYV